MKRVLLITLYCLVSALTYSQNVEVACGGLSGIRQGVTAATGLDAVYVVYQANDSKVDIRYLQDDGASIIWYRIDKNGNKSIIPGATSAYLSGVEGDCGYVYQQGNKTGAIWIVNYLNYSLAGIDMTVERDEYDECNSVRLILNGTVEKLPYYTIAGKQMFLPEEFYITYYTLEWDKDIADFKEVLMEEKVTDSNYLSVQAPTCNTEFVLTDKYLKEWGMESSVKSEEYISVTPICGAVVEQHTRDYKNEWDREQPSDGSFGGSAPVDMTFKAYYNDVVTHSDWQFSKDKDFNVIDAHYYNADDFQYTFNQEGTTYVRLMVSTGTCQDSTEVYTVTVGESRLEAPNIFSPGTTPGVNDEWKVAYKSIISFKCWIFNRWGVQMFHFEDPAIGWDGKYKGKLVDPGVYFYVIEAKGADGKSHNLKGHINIIRSKN